MPELTTKRDEPKNSILNSIRNRCNSTVSAFVDKFTKLSKCFAADILQFFTEKCQNSAFRIPAGYSPSNPSILVVFLKVPNFIKS